jgi:hypothetical protein
MRRLRTAVIGVVAWACRMQGTKRMQNAIQFVRVLIDL